MKRRIILWILIVAFVWLVVSRFAEIKRLAETLSRGQLEWVAAAALIQFLYYINWTYIYQAGFQTVEVKTTIRQLLPVVLASLFVNVIVPTMGSAGMALFVDDAARRGESPSRAAAGMVLVLAAHFLSFVAVLIPALVYLFLRHDLATYQLIGAALFFVYTLVECGVLAIGLWKPGVLLAILTSLQKLINRLASWIHRTSPLEENWAEKNAAEFTDASRAIADHPWRLARTLLASLIAHVVDLASLYVLFLAFHYPVSLGALLVGYAIGILFWIVAITPQGIGVVEGVMALVFTSLGVPGDIATIVTLAFRGLTFWLPLLIGFFLMRYVPSFGAEERAKTDVWNVRLVAILTGLIGAVNVISAVMPANAGRIALLRDYLPLEVRRGSHLAASLAGFALLLLAGNLWRRKRVAYLVTLVMLLIAALSDLGRGLYYAEAGIALLLAVWLFSMRSSFHARSDPPSIAQGIRVTAAAFLFTLAYGVGGFYFLDRHFSQHFGIDSAIRQTVIMFTQFYDPGLQPITGFGRYFASSIYVISSVTFGYALWLLVRPVLVRQPASPSDREKACAIVTQFGCTPLARLTLLPDKHYYFTDRGSMIAYQPRQRIALALGDPIGPEEDFPPAVQGFKDLCERNDWEPVFYQTMPDHLDLYRAAGFQALTIGHEAVVKLAEFGLDGNANKALRYPYNRLLKMGYQAIFHQPPIPADLLEELREVSDEWLTMMHGGEMRFSVGWFDEEYLRSTSVIAIRKPSQPDGHPGMLVAFANIIPEYRRNEASIDLMRRRQEIENGTMEFLFVSLLQWARQQGYATFSLGLSALSGIGESSEDPAIDRALHYIYDHVSRFYNFKGLHAFKAKFRPEWEPRYLIYPGPASLPAIALALLQGDKN